MTESRNPESLGWGLVVAGTVSPAMLAAVFTSNVPEGLSSTAGMKKAGRGAKYVFGIWTAIALFLRTGLTPGLHGLGKCSGGILAMLGDSMIPEVFEEHHDLSGFTAAVGFLTAFTIHRIGG